MSVASASTNIIAVLDVVVSLLELTSEVQRMVQIAQNEGRDLTDEELAVFRTRRQAAFDRLMAL